MRLWSIRPDLLDRMGLLGLWREALQAQKILEGGPPYKVPYGNHPQLRRFKKHSDPLKVIGKYLSQIFDESVNRGYNFNSKLIKNFDSDYVTPIYVSLGQVNYEMRFLLHKLHLRSKEKWEEVMAEVERLRKFKESYHPFQRRLISNTFWLDTTNQEPESWEKLKEF